MNIDVKKSTKPVKYIDAIEFLEKKGFKAKIKIESGINELIKVFTNSKENIVNNY